jgi:hypothetical protein
VGSEPSQMKKWTALNYTISKKRDPAGNVCFLTASSEMDREKLGNYELNKDLFLNMPLPIKEIEEKEADGFTIISSL